MTWDESARCVNGRRVAATPSPRHATRPRAGVITLSCDDFVDFMGGYFIELGMGLCEQVYFDPALVDIIDGAFYYWNELKAKTLKLLPKWC